MVAKNPWVWPYFLGGGIGVIWGAPLDSQYFLASGQNYKNADIYF